MWFRRSIQELNGIQVFFFLTIIVRKENEKYTIICSPSQQNLEFGQTFHIYLLFAEDSKENVPMKIYKAGVEWLF